MSRDLATLAPEVLSDSDLDMVTGGSGFMHFVMAIAIAGTANAGGSSAPTDSSVATHTQLWVVSAS